MKKYSVWVYVFDSNTDCEPDVRVYPTKHEAKEAVKRSFNEYVNCDEYKSTEVAKANAREEFEESKNERFHITLYDGKMVHCFAECRSFDYFSTRGR